MYVSYNQFTTFQKIIKQTYLCQVSKPNHLNAHSGAFWTCYFLLYPAISQIVNFKGTLNSVPFVNPVTHQDLKRELPFSNLNSSLCARPFDALWPVLERLFDDYFHAHDMSINVIHGFFSLYFIYILTISMDYCLQKK
ncbi:Hypothetical_protein [Hexamita inflata]|uniref:Hypothetical_protein n=1 Tax=Hexamita inflata TaxID=28002 RepID=A0AA86TW17_9EUKA|nr:Hypothetical protein HINF_LOCUS18584 [Hexamita inflata]